MNKEIKKAWVAALRSKRYKKGTVHMHNVQQETWCPLGVLCHVSNIPSGNNGVVAYFGEPKDGNTLIPDAKLTKQLGLTEKQRNSIWENNDNEDYTFAETAKWIEKNI